MDSKGLVVFNGAILSAKLEAMTLIWKEMRGMSFCQPASNDEHDFSDHEHVLYLNAYNVYK
jgi:hypothetical protein